MAEIHDLTKLFPERGERLLFAGMVAKLEDCLAESDADLTGDAMARLGRRVRLTRVLSENARLWRVMLDSLADPENELSPALRELLVATGSAGLELGRRALDSSEALPLLVSLIRAVVDGLDKAHPAGAAPAAAQPGNSPPVVVNLDQARAERRSREEDHATGAPERWRILIVEDEESVRKTLHAFLESAGFEVETAQNGGQALAFLALQRFDLAVVDIFMPEVDGLETIRTARWHGAPPIVAISGGSVAEKCSVGDDGIDVLAAARKLGAVATLRKPFTSAQLVSAVTGALAARRA